VIDGLQIGDLYGAIFDRPQPDGPAAQAKIQAGDVLTAINSSVIPRLSANGLVIGLTSTAASRAGFVLPCPTVLTRQMIGGTRVPLLRRPLPLLRWLSSR
jgi:hypothetical protein